MHRNNPLRWSKSLSDLHAKNINFWQNVLDFQVSLQRTADPVTCMTMASLNLEAPGSVMASVVFFLLILAAYMHPAACKMAFVLIHPFAIQFRLILIFVFNNYSKI